MDRERLNAQNMQVCFLTQAMCGAITPNWRSVSMTFDGDEVHLHFVLEHESTEDREEIEDVKDEFSIFQEDARPYRLGIADVSVTEGDLQWHNHPDIRLVYRRKESS
jgi:hypothetical protein